VGTVKPRDDYFSRDDRFSLGVDEESGRYYASFPVNSSAVGYEEYYELDADQYRRFLAEPGTALGFIKECRRHERDELLLEQPGWNRGTPA
jgi:hypothetical protein